jgi:hypothetical protein
MSGVAGQPNPPVGEQVRLTRALSRASVVRPDHHLTLVREDEGSGKLRAAKEHDSAVIFKSDE